MGSTQTKKKKKKKNTGTKTKAGSGVKRERGHHSAREKGNFFREGKRKGVRRGPPARSDSFIGDRVDPEGVVEKGSEGKLSRPGDEGDWWRKRWSL